VVPVVEQQKLQGMSQPAGTSQDLIVTTTAWDTLVLVLSILLEQTFETEVLWMVGATTIMMA
jgi:hypothetical protein